jgi:hypothetical protein
MKNHYSIFNKKYKKNKRANLKKTNKEKSIVLKRIKSLFE